MRPEKFRRLMNKGISEKIKFGCGKNLGKLTPYMEKVYNNYSNYEGDFRSGFETYGYADEESIKSTLSYISDRWMAAFRLKWIIDGVKLGYI